MTQLPPAGTFQVGSPDAPMPVSMPGAVDPTMPPPPGQSFIPRPGRIPTPAEMVGDDEVPVRELPSHISDPHGPPDSSTQGPAVAVQHPMAIAANPQHQKIQAPPIDEKAVEDDMTQVQFVLEAGTFVTSYPVVILADSCVVLGHRKLLPGSAIFEPATGSDLMLDVDGIRFKVLSLNLKFKVGDLNLLVLPVRPPEMGEE